MTVFPIDRWTRDFSGYIDANLTWEGWSNTLSTFVYTLTTLDKPYNVKVEIISADTNYIGPEFLTTTNAPAQNEDGYVAAGTYRVGVSAAPDGHGLPKGHYTVRLYAVQDDGDTPFALGQLSDTAGVHDLTGALNIDDGDRFGFSATRPMRVSLTDDGARSTMGIFGDTDNTYAKLVDVSEDGKTRYYDIGVGNFSANIWGGGSQYSVKLQFASYISLPLFGNDNDAVDFNTLTPFQVQAVESGASLYDAREGDDVVTLPNISDAVKGYNPAIAFHGGKGNDFIHTGALSDLVYGDEGNDTFYGASGGDRVYGGAGDDTFNLQDGDLGSGSPVTLDGGGNTTGGVDTLLLPGSPGDYVISTKFSTIPSRTTTEISASSTGHIAIPRIVTTGIEKVTFAGSIENTIELFHDGDAQAPDTKKYAHYLTAEMAKLAKEVYGPLPTTGRGAEPLAFENVNDKSPPITADAVARGWHAVSAMELGIAPASILATSSSGTLTWSFKDGHYAAKETTPNGLGQSLINLKSGDIPEANAIVLTGQPFGGGRSLAIALRGTDQIADFGTYPNFSTYYKMFSPLIEGIKSYVQETGLEAVLISGHSLGGGATQYLVRELSSVLPSNVEIKSWTFGSPGSEIVPPENPVNFVHTADPVAVAAPVATNLVQFGMSNAVVAAVVFQIANNFAPKARSGSDILLSSDVAGNLNISEHSQSLYVQDVLKVTRFSYDGGSPFSKTALAEALSDGNIYAGEGLRIGLGQPVDIGSFDSIYASRITANAADNFVLGNEQDDRFDTFGGDRIADGKRVFDGAGGTDSIFIWSDRADIKLDNYSDADGLAATRITDNSLILGGQIGIAYRIEKLIFRDQTTDMEGNRIAAEQPDGSAARLAAALAATPSVFTLQGTAEVADAGDGDMTVIGTANGDIIYAGRGNKTIYGSGGDDTIIVRAAAGTPPPDETVMIDGGPGADTMVAGPGRTTLIVDNVADAAIGDIGIDSVRSSVTYTLLAGVENLALVGSGPKDATGNELANLLVGNESANVLDGRAGSDRMEGGGGDDVYVVDHAGDTVIETANGGVDTVVAAISYVLPTDVDKLVLTGSQTVNGTGNELDNTLVGNAGANWLNGMQGVDILSGGAGADTLIGGLGDDILDGGTNPELGQAVAQGDIMLGGDGNDTYFVDSGLDFVDEGSYFPTLGFGGNDTIISTTDFYWDVASVGEVIQVADNVVDLNSDGVTLVGGVFDNTLIGHSGTDVLFGRGGSDTYRAGDGVDFISLSTLGVPDAANYKADGNNVIIVDPRKTGPNSYDIVFEFDPAKDRIDVSHYTGAHDYKSVAEVLARAVDDGAGNCYIALGDGLDYVYLVGVLKAQLLASDFIV